MKPKIIFLDLEGTLLKIPPIATQTGVSQSAWTVLAELLGKECLREEEFTQRKWEAKGYFNYLEWMEDTIRIHQKYKLDRRTFDTLVDMIEKMPGIRSAAARFHEWGAKLAIITGGFKVLADKAQLAMRAHHSFAACEYFFDTRGSLVHWNLLPSDYAGKSEFMRLLIREYEVQSAQCVFVGDGSNDIYLAKEVGVSIAFNAQEPMKHAATHAIDQVPGSEDFSVVADIIAKQL